MLPRGQEFAAEPIYGARTCSSVQFVLVQFLRVGGLGRANGLRRSGFTFRVQGKMHTVKSGEHRHRVIAPQSAMAPNDVLWYAHDPTGHTGIAGVDKLPPAPVFLPSRRTCFIRIVIWT